MRLSLTLLRYSAGLAVRGGSSAMRGEGRAVQSRPVRRVEKIIIRATSKVEGTSYFQCTCLTMSHATAPSDPRWTGRELC